MFITSNMRIQVAKPSSEYNNTQKKSSRGNLLQDYEVDVCFYSPKRQTPSVNSFVIISRDTTHVSVF